MIKLFAFDLDGTLLQNNQEIDRETVEMLKSQEDIRYILATGRGYALVEDIVKTYDLNCDLILNNGHEFLSHDKTVHFTYSFANDKIKRICEILTKYDFHISLQSGNGNKYTFTELEKYYEQHLEMSSKVRNRDISSLLTSPLFARESYLKNTVLLKSIEELDDLCILKIDAKNLDKEINSKALEELKAIDNIAITTSFESYIEICDNSMDKGKLLLQVANNYGISADEIAVFGDSDNDIELLQAVPHSFAMGNGKEELKKHAAHITDTNDNQGVLKGMIKILEAENYVKL